MLHRLVLALHRLPAARRRPGWLLAQALGLQLLAPALPHLLLEPQSQRLLALPRLQHPATMLMQSGGRAVLCGRGRARP